MQPKKEELESIRSEKQELEKALQTFQELKLTLDMTRGKPSPEQLDLSNDMLALPGADTYLDSFGNDVRNYGMLDGLPEAKVFFAEYMGVSDQEIIVGGNSSLSLMHDTLTFAMLHGYPESEKPWCKQEEVKFLCPVPGYDRHFAVCETLGIKMLPVEMDENGPNMEVVADLVKNDSTIKGIWCVPQYSNPTGIIYSKEVVERLAAMDTAAPDFKIMWDNAYAKHHLTDNHEEVANLLAVCKKVGNPDRAIMFGSTSKISMGGAGIAVIASSKSNVAWYKKYLSKQTIGSDKVNQLRHLKFFGNVAGLQDHMVKHAAVLKPKFDKVVEVLTNELGSTGYAIWTKPEGGYFISLDVAEGCASRVVSLCAEYGVKMTSAGATYPYGKDPQDANIRIAPSLPKIDAIEQAMLILAKCIKIAVSEKYG